jgi:tRNA 2-thiouridine synthesizing protein A
MRTESIAPRVTMDLRDEVCPYTFIRTKLALDGMEPGQVLEITLRGIAIENVPRSIKEEGHSIIHVVRKGELFVFHIRKCDAES